MADCWVIGPIAWDWPYRIDGIPPSGGVAQAVRLPGRLGGTGANVARALASRGQAVEMVGYVGDDEWGTRSVADLRERGIGTQHVSTLRGPTSQVLLFVEPDGERTIIGVAEDRLEQVDAPDAHVMPGDLVYFAAWRAPFETLVERLAARGARIASVPFAPAARPLPVRHVIGSMSELPMTAAKQPFRAYERWTAGLVENVVLTRGPLGARRAGPDGDADLPAVVVRAADTTGAGDAFAAAVLASIAAGRPLDEGIEEGLRWGAATSASEGSIPPPWGDVRP
jgi:sugar/nucleoside kinase (ribokinase family)